MLISMLKSSSKKLFFSIAILMCIVGLPAYKALAKNIFVAPVAGKMSGGTRKQPYDLPMLLNGKVQLLPGDTINLAGGDYFGDFNFHFEGTPEKQIVIRSVPGETAVLHGHIDLKPGTRYLTLMDFEICADRSKSWKRVSRQRGSSVKDIYSAAGITAGSSWMNGIKIINLVIHDVPDNGIENWTRSVNSEVYGNIVYNNGWDGPDRGHGHGIYTQNDTGTKVYEENICFWNLGTCGIKIYSESGTTSNFYLEGNIHFNPDCFLIGGYKPVRNITMRNNYMGEGANLVLGYRSKDNSGLRAWGNYLMKTTITEWQQMNMRHNVFLEGIDMNAPVNLNQYKMDSDVFYPYTGGSGGDLQMLKQKGLEKNSTKLNNYPAVPEVFVRPNKYEPGRAHIVVYNWPKYDSVPVDLSDILKKGDAFEIIDVQHYSAGGVIKGIYKGALIKIPMTLTKTDELIGDFSNCYHSDIIKRTHTSKAFGVFLVRKPKRNM